ncbi:hypothetical protein [Sphingomonas sp. CCH5-D11]|uniref:hypothetical protein n=1 Tax=Sphingomonas sp. CCH5-D11 TaxID=1768786 RepID=UPI00082C7C80|nr:hypothetical protein [Sphingomonas sp. CCH5-D11]
MFDGREVVYTMGMTDTESLRAKITEIKTRFDADPDAFLASTTNLRDADFALMGKLIQLYCYADLNARRIIDALRHAAHGPGARNASRLQDAQVFPKLREIVAELWESNLKEGVLKAADTVEMHRLHRHNFAHWAARRVGSEEALVLFTKNAREAERRDGDPQDPDQLKYGIVPLDGFAEELVKLEGHADYLAQSAAHVERHLTEFTERFAEMKK